MSRFQSRPLDTTSNNQLFNGQLTTLQNLVTETGVNPADKYMLIGGQDHSMIRQVNLGAMAPQCGLLLTTTDMGHNNPCESFYTDKRADAQREADQRFFEGLADYEEDLDQSENSTSVIISQLKDEISLCESIKDDQ